MEGYQLKTFNACIYQGKEQLAAYSSEVQDFGQQQDTDSSTQAAVDSHGEEPVETAKEC